MSKRDTSGPRRGIPFFAIAAVLVIVAAVVVGISVSSRVVDASSPPAIPVSAPPVTAPPATLVTVTSPLNLLSSAPSPGAKNVPPNSDIKLTFSGAVDLSSVHATLSPYVAGQWEVSGPSELVFVPSASFVPYTKEVLTIPGGPGGIQGLNGATMNTTQKLDFTIASGSVLRLQQLLSQLGYLPLNFVPQNSEPLSGRSMALPELGTFSWRWSTLPTSLTALWSPGKMNVLTKGAIMQFESQVGLTTDGIAGPAVWSNLLNAVASGKVDSAPYDYVTVTKALPEHVTVYSNGAVAIVTPANTGVPAAPTTNGTFPVYLRYRTTTMKGTNPDGTHYDDHNVPWVSYFNGGQGLHGFVRPGYGYPQSVGCVEMPIPTAAKVWPLTPIGTLVTVE